MEKINNSEMEVKFVIDEKDLNGLKLNNKETTLDEYLCWGCDGKSWNEHKKD